MTYHKCARCDFFVTFKDEYCANCGLVRPLDPLEYKDAAAAENAKVRRSCLSVIGFFAVFTFLGFISANILRSYTGGGPTDLAFPMIVTVLVASIGIVYGMNKLFRLGIIPDSERQFPQNLQQSEEIIRQRLHELEKREGRIKDVLSRILIQNDPKQNKESHWLSLRETLKAAQAPLQNQYARYRVKELEIELVRWQNKLAPLTSGLESISYEQVNTRLKSIDAIRESGIKMHFTLESQKPVLGANTDLKELIARLDETLTSCKKVHDALIARQAVLALKEVTPLKDALHPVPSPTGTIRELEVFNAQVAITDFSTSFKELEAEYVRIHSEEDLGQQISHILEKAEGQ